MKSTYSRPGTVRPTTLASPAMAGPQVRAFVVMSSLLLLLAVMGVGI